MGEGPEAISGAFAFLSFFLKIFFFNVDHFFLKSTMCMAALGLHRCTSFSLVLGSGQRHCSGFSRCGTQALGLQKLRFPGF